MFRAYVLDFRAFVFVFFLGGGGGYGAGLVGFRSGLCLVCSLGVFIFDVELLSSLGSPGLVSH